MRQEFRPTVTVPPSGRLLNVPDTGDELVLSTMVKIVPPEIAPVGPTIAGDKSALLSVTPLATTLSIALSEGLNSSASVASDRNVSAPVVVNVPIPALPGANVAPLPTPVPIVTVLEVEPEPPKVPALTATGATSEPFRSKVPALIVVVPV